MDRLSDEEIEAAAAAVERGAAKLGGGPTDQGWVVRAREGRLWFKSWYARGDSLDEEEREIDGAELRAMLRRYGRKVILKP
jgi:hypothetical protein